MCRSLLDHGAKVIINKIDAVIKQLKDEFINQYQDRVIFINDISKVKRNIILLTYDQNININI